MELGNHFRVAKKVYAKLSLYRHEEKRKKEKGDDFERWRRGGGREICFLNYSVALRAREEVLITRLQMWDLITGPPLCLLSNQILTGNVPHASSFRCFVA